MNRNIVPSRSSYTLLALVLLSIFSTSFLYSQNLSYKKDTVVISRLKAPIVFDGFSNEEAWEGAFKMDFITHRPVWGAPPSEHTEMLTGFDDENLYIAGRCYTKDSSKLVIRNLVRDGWRGDDWMTFHIDNTFDQQNALIFSIYPMGSRYDAAIGNDGVSLGVSAFNQDFNMFWDARSVVTAEGWFFEMKIPLYNLRLRNDKDGKIRVGISAARILQNPQEMQIYPAIPQNILDGMSKPSAKQPAILEGAIPQKLFLVTPYALSAANRVNDISIGQNAFQRSSSTDFQPGLDIKAGINPYLTLDLSVNPDFAQVEADDQLLNLTRFSLFFPEKRLFFQESAGLFDFNLGGNTQMFYSRQIGINEGLLTRVYGGARLTGKLNQDTDIGFLNMQTTAISNDAGELIRGSENFTTLRMRHKFINQQSFIGFIATNRWSANRVNTGFGLDMMLNPTGDHYFLAAMAVTKDSNTDFDPGASRLNLRYELRKTDGIFGDFTYTYSGKEFNPLSGFLDRTDFHQWRGNLNYGKFAQKNSSRFQYIRWQILNLDAYRGITNNAWETVDLSTGIGLNTFKGEDFNLGFSYNYEFLPFSLNFSENTVITPGTYNFGSATFSYLQPRASTFRNFVSISEGLFFDGRRFSFSYNPILNLGTHWEIQALYSLNYLRFDSGNEAIQIGRIRLNYALNLHLSVNYVIQYNSLNRQVFNNFRFRYNFSDGHDLYLVWNENFYTDRTTAWDDLRPVSGIQNFIVKYNVTFDRIFRKSA